MEDTSYWVGTRAKYTKVAIFATELLIWLHIFVAVFATFSIQCSSSWNSTQLASVLLLLHCFSSVGYIASTLATFSTPASILSQLCTLSERKSGKQPGDNSSHWQWLVSHSGIFWFHLVSFNARVSSLVSLLIKSESPRVLEGSTPIPWQVFLWRHSSKNL